MSIQFLFTRFLLALFGIAFAIGMVYGLLLLFPSLVPADDSDRVTNQELQVEYYLTDGDLFFQLAGAVKPPAEDVLLSQHVFRTDENGFRIPAMTQPTYADYDIVALGDSFTEAWMVSDPWTDQVAAQLDKTILNLSYRGYGPLEYAALMEEFGQSNQREWILIAFFEGNDLENIRDTTTRAPTNEGGNPLVNLTQQVLDPRDENFEIVESENYRYPLGLFIGAGYYEMAFFDNYLWMLNAAPEVYAESQNMMLFEQSLADIKAVSGDACVAVVYLPSKPHIYFPYAEEFGRRWVLEANRQMTLGDDDWIEIGELDQSPFEDVIANFDHQRDAIAEVVQAQGLHFIDLTPAFQATSAAPAQLYFTYDTHWNPAGHTLAAEVVSDYLSNTPCR